ncbi:hypothetical protein HUE57_17200 [Candidatus Reidiella endopervernicosa]|uniref:Uncharacterized protein n=2 Tax=Candidatus Reidiella endopervernicosa TaxID=2738883 RepID=A0A6N0HZR6_9GAMM|nr:hypothetical protein HUE57_17200 [Candidatus Reidiella endopervernicosa]
MIADNEQRITQIELLINPNPVTKSEQQSNDKWLSGVAIFAEECFGHPSPSKRQILNATVYAFGAPTVLRTLRNHLFAALHNSLSDSTPT